MRKMLQGWGCILVTMVSRIHKGFGFDPLPPRFYV